MAAVSNPWDPPRDWELGGVPIHRMMTVERRKGVDKAVVQKALVDLQVSRHRPLNDSWYKVRVPRPTIRGRPCFACNYGDIHGYGDKLTELYVRCDGC